MARKRTLAKVAAKTEAVAAETAKAAAEKTEAVKEVVAEKTEAVKEVVAEKTDAVKDAVKEATEKTTAKKPAKKEIKVRTFVQYYGKEVEEKEMIAAVKKDWTKVNGKKVGDIKDITLYVKPEEAAVYYVVNGTDSGKVAF